MTGHFAGWAWVASALVPYLATAVAVGERVERFDADPKWEGRNNRTAEPRPRTVR